MVRALVRISLPLITGIHRFIFEKSGHRMGWGAAGFQFLVLENLGRKSGILRQTPLLFVPHEGNWLVAASNAGQDKDPVWWLNLRDQPDVFIHTREGRHAVHARRAAAAEEEKLWEIMTEVMPWFGSYRAGTTRTIPLIILEPRIAPPGEVGG